MPRATETASSRSSAKGPQMPSDSRGLEPATAGQYPEGPKQQRARQDAYSNVHPLTATADASSMNCDGVGATNPGGNTAVAVIRSTSAGPVDEETGVAVNFTVACQCKSAIAYTRGKSSLPEPPRSVADWESSVTLGVPWAGYAAATMARRAATTPGLQGPQWTWASSTQSPHLVAGTVGACKGSPRATRLLQRLTQSQRAGRAQGVPAPTNAPLQCLCPVC